MEQCPKGQATSRQVKKGFTGGGSQRYQCQCAERRIRRSRKAHGYGEALRQQAVKLYVDGMNFRRIARHLGVSHQTVINWVNAAIAQLAPAPLPEQVEVGEMDELHSFVGHKKTKSLS